MTETPSAQLDDAVRNCDVIVCVGGGGVGKTTLAATMAIRGAQLGRRSVVVTIDPARRLADALGVEELSNDATIIESDAIGTTGSGALAALMLDAKATFDALVREHAQGPAQAERILANRFYRTVSSGLSGTQEYMAMEKLAALHQSEEHDLVVIDTPPHQRTVDVLNASNQLTRLFDNRVFKLIVTPRSGIARSVGRASRSLVRTLAQIVGADVIDDAIAFFSAFEGMEEGFRRRSQDARDLLTGDRTAFVLVCAPRSDAIADAGHLVERLGDASITVEAAVVNRIHPTFGPADPDELAIAASDTDNPVLAELLVNLADARRTAVQEYELTQDVATLLGSAPVTVPLLEDDITHVEGLVALTHVVFGAAMT